VRETARRALLWVAERRGGLGGRRLDPLSGRFAPYHGIGRRRLTLLLDATNRCNLRCVMCHFARPEARREKRVELTPADLARVEREILPRVKHAYLSAGTEPLMWKGFPGLLDACARAGVPEFELITNGTLLDEELAGRIVSSGATRVQLSVDGATSETYEAIRAGGRFADFLRGLRLLVEARGRAALPVLQFNVILMERNLHELGALLRLAAANGVRFLDVRHLVVLPGLGMEAQSLRARARETNAALAEARVLAKELGLELVRFPAPFPEEVGEGSVSVETVPFAPPAAHGPAPEPAERRTPALPASLPARPRCSAPWEQVFVRPDGRVVPCCFWYTDDALGDLHRQPFEEIWEGRPYRRLRAELLSGELGPNCAHCPVLGIGDPADPRAYEAGATAGP
jgi:radical SAM protein with 4Fe4S-binding SPASM domain